MAGILVGGLISKGSEVEAIVGALLNKFNATPFIEDTFSITTPTTGSDPLELSVLFTTFTTRKATKPRLAPCRFAFKGL